MKAEVKWLEESKFVAESGTGHSVVLDTPDSNKGPSPMEMLLIGMGGCTGIDVISILKKARQKVQDCCVQIEAEREDDYPRIFRKIHLHFILSGTNLSEHQVQRAIQLSQETYCAASIIMGRSGAEVTHSYEIVTESQEGKAS